MVMSQVSAVVYFASQIISSFQPGDDIRTHVTKESKLQISQAIVQAMSEGDVALSEEARTKYDSPQKLLTYVQGMVTNHFNKCKTLNGGKEFTIKNPGSKSGSTQLKQALSLKAKMELEGRTPPQELLDLISQEQVKTPKLKVQDFSSLPETLQALA